MNIKDKIRKLLALAESPNENEAREALLKARALAAEHKLHLDECTRFENSKVIKKYIGVTVSAKKYAWAVELSAIIAEHYCCKAFRGSNYRSQSQSIGICGLEEDFEICRRIFLYAFDCARTASERIFSEKSDIYTGTYRRKIAESYGYGFCSGLREAFDKQNEAKKEEWGLVLVTPNEVMEAMSELGPPKSYGKVEIGDAEKMRAAQKGFSDGVSFNPARILQ